MMRTYTRASPMISSRVPIQVRTGLERSRNSTVRISADARASTRETARERFISFMFFAPNLLGDEDGEPLGQPGTDAQAHPVEPVGGAQSRQGVHAHHLSYHSRVYERVGCLKDIAHHKREGKEENLRPAGPHVMSFSFCFCDHRYPPFI